MLISKLKLFILKRLSKFRQWFKKSFVHKMCLIYKRKKGCINIQSGLVPYASHFMKAQQNQILSLSERLNCM